MFRFGVRALLRAVVPFALPAVAAARAPAIVRIRISSGAGSGALGSGLYFVGLRA